MREGLGERKDGQRERKQIRLEALENPENLQELEQPENRENLCLTGVVDAALLDLSISSVANPKEGSAVVTRIAAGTAAADLPCNPLARLRAARTARTPPRLVVPWIGHF